jgi:hypothetical protein
MNPTPQQKLAITNRLNVLKSQLSCDATNDQALAVELARMLSAFPAPHADAQSTKLRMQAYFEALDGIPVWAVSAARLAALRGEGDCDPRFAPTPTQIALLAKSRLQNIRDEIALLDKLARAKVESPEPAPDEYERVSRGFADLKALLTPEVKDPGPTFADMCAAAGVDPDSIQDAPVRAESIRPPALRRTG